MKATGFSLLLFSLIILLGACAANPVTGQQELALMTEQQEISLGRESHGQVLQQYGKYDNPELQAYVQSIGEQLARNSHRNNLIYRFTVLDSKEVNAFALPGGYIYITRGLMSYLNSEAELAAVLGHEIGHVTARHAVRQYSAAQLAGIGATLGAIFIPGMNTAAGSQLTQVLGTAILRGYGREHELESDRLGAEYLARANYNPHAMFEVIRALKNQEVFEVRQARAEGREPNIYHGLFSTHPDNDTRLKEVISYAEKNIKTASPKLNREQYLNKIDGMVFGDNAEQGVLRGSHFYHTTLGISFRFPEKWKVINQPDRLVGISADGNSILQIALQDINKKISPREFIITRLGVNQLTLDKALDINGNPAHTGLAPIKTSYGQRQGRVTVIYFNNQAYIFIGINKQKEFDQNSDRYFLETAQSFHALTENERKIARPLHLKLITAGSNARFDILAQQSPLEYFPADQLRLINGLYPDREPESNKLLKIVE